MRTAAWGALLLVGLAIFVFGLVHLTDPESDPVTRGQGLAMIGAGVFGLAITAYPFERRERWAWYVLWFYPLFWLIHLVGELGPGLREIVEVLLLLVSLAGLLLVFRDFFPRRIGAGAPAGARGSWRPRWRRVRARRWR